MSAATDIPSDFGHWLAGFIDGEGTFAISRENVRRERWGYGCKFILKLRDDDRAILEQVAVTTGIGRVYDKRAGSSGRNSRPQVAWQIQSRADCLALIDVLDAHPLRSRKAAAYAVWRAAVLTWAHALNGGATSWEANELVWERMGDLRVELAQANGYAVPVA